MIQGIFEIQLVTAQYERMAGFYRDVLGLAKLFSDDDRGRMHFALGTGQLILAQEHGEHVLPDWPGVPPRMYTDDDETVSGPLQHGPVHYAFHVDDDQWAALESRIKSNNDVEVRGPMTWGTGYQSLYFKDPDGNCVELIREL